MQSYRSLAVMLLTGALMLSGLASNALALTNACETISNQASLTYTVGGVPQVTPVLSDGDPAAGIQSTDFLVATKVDLTVANSTVGKVVTATGADNVMTFSITNTGNDLQRYSLAVWAAANNYDVFGDASYVDNFDMNSVRVYTDTNNAFDPALGDGEVLVNNAVVPDGTPLGYTANVAGNNGVIYVHIVANVPAGQVNGDDAIYALQAITSQAFGQVPARNGGDGNEGTETDETATTSNGCGSAVVLADGDIDAAASFPESTGGTLSDIARNGDSYDVGVFTVDTATITVSKSYEVIDDFVNTAAPYQAIPGALVRYTITISNGSATTPATALNLTDQIPDFTDFVVGSLSVPDGTGDLSTTAPPGPPVGGYSPGGAAGTADAAVTYVLATIPNLAASGTTTVTFDVFIE